VTNAQALRDAVEQLATPQGRAYLRGCIACYNLAPDDVDDLVSEAIARALERAEQYRGTADPRSWLAVIIINAARNHVTRRTPTAPDDEVPETTAPDDTARHAIARVELSAALGSLPPDFGQSIADCIILGYREASDRHGTPVGTLKARVSRWRSSTTKATE
jgi:RNA polymerase sigma factor (sigma-70 family)